MFLLANLNGEIEIFDRNNFESMYAISVGEISQINWSINGRNFLVARVKPKCKQNTGFSVYNYQGEILNNFEIADLCEIQFRPNYDILKEPFSLSGNQTPQKPLQIENFIPGLPPTKKKRKKRHK